MKRTISFIVLSLFIGCATAEVNDTTTVIDLPGQSKKAIYEKSIQWITYKFVSGRAVIDYKDFGVGRIIGKGTIKKIQPNSMGASVEMDFVATIDCLPNKARIIVERNDCFSVAPNGGRFPCSRMYVTPSVFKEIEGMAQMFSDEYKSYMTGGRGAAWDGK